MSAYIRQEAAQQGESSGTAITGPAFSLSCLVGSTIEVWVVAGGTSVPTTVVDSAGQSYSKLQSTNDGYDGQELSLWVFQNNQSPTTLSVTANFASSAGNAGVWAKEITGVQASSVKASVIAYVAIPGTATNAISSGAITAGDLLSSLCAGGTYTMVADAGATSGTTGFVQSGQPYGLSESYVGSNTTAFYTDSTGGATGHYLVGAITYVATLNSVIVNSSGLQQFSNTAGPVTYLTTWPVGAHNTLLVLCTSTDDNLNGDGIASIADNVDGDYSQDKSYEAATHVAEQSYSLSGTTAGARTLTLTMNASAAAYGNFVVVELAGVWTFDAALGTNKGSGTAPTVTGTTPAANDFQVTIFIGASSNTEPANIPSGWNDSYMGIPASGFPSAGYAWLQSASAAGVTNWGALGSSITWGAMIVGYSPPTAGTTLVASGGSFALTGEAAVLTQAQVLKLTLLANPGCFDYQGAKSQSYLQLYANTGAFNLTGENAAFQIGLGAFSIAGGTGLYALTGKNATLQAGAYVFSAFTGYFGLSGESAALVVTGGPTPPGYEFLPNYVGLDWLEASLFLYQGGYAEIDPSIVRLKKPTTQQGIVLGQAPAANTLVKVGTAVQLSVGSDHMLAVSFEAI